MPLKNNVEIKKEDIKNPVNKPVESVNEDKSNNKKEDIKNPVNKPVESVNEDIKFLPPGYEDQHKDKEAEKIYEKLLYKKEDRNVLAKNLIYITDRTSIKTILYLFNDPNLLIGSTKTEESTNNKVKLLIEVLRKLNKEELNNFLLNLTYKKPFGSTFYQSIDNLLLNETFIEEFNLKNFFIIKTDYNGYIKKEYNEIKEFRGIIASPYMRAKALNDIISHFYGLEKNIDTLQSFLENNDNHFITLSQKVFNTDKQVVISKVKKDLSKFLITYEATECEVTFEELSYHSYVAMFKTIMEKEKEELAKKILINNLFKK